MITAQQLGLIEKSPIVAGTLQAVSDEHGDGGVDFEEFVRELTTKLVICMAMLREIHLSKREESNCLH